MTTAIKVVLDPRLSVAENHAKAFCELIESRAKATSEVLIVAEMTEIFQQAINDARFMSGQH